MVEENAVQPQTKKEERALSLLDQVKQAKEEVEQTLAEVRSERIKLQELKADEMLAGKTDAGKPPEKPREETPQEYRRRFEEEMRTGKVSRK